MALSTRWLIGVAAVVAAVVLASIAVVALAGQEELLPADTPGGTVQRYLQAVLDRDADAALAYLAPELRERCDDRPLREQIAGPWRSEFRAVLEETRERGDVTEVVIRITEGEAGGPFDGGGWTHEELFVLAQVDGEWRFVEPPFPIGFCPERPPPTPGTT